MVENISSSPSSTYPLLHDRLHAIICIAFDSGAPSNEVGRFKSGLLECSFIVHTIELTGKFDFLVEAAVPSMTAFDEGMKSVAEPLAKLCSAYEIHFVRKRVVRRCEDDPALWVPTDDGFKRIAFDSIDKVTAEGDYMRVHAHGDNWLLHGTMRSLAQRLPGDQFVQLHRSTLVRCRFINALIRKRQRWQAKLDDGSTEPVAKSRVRKTLAATRDDSTITGGRTTKNVNFVELSRQLVDK